MASLSASLTISQVLFIAITAHVSALYFLSLLLSPVPSAILVTVGLAFWSWLLLPLSARSPNEATRRGICHDRFAAEKIPQGLDAVVIGSGMSGLSCAAILAQTGKKVLVLEQHTVAGGGTHTFELSKGYRFDSGLHYVVPYCAQLLQIACGTQRPPVSFEIIGRPDGTFDKVVIGDSAPFPVQYKEGHLAEIYRVFPAERRSIDRFVQITDSVLLGFPLWALSRCLPLWLQRVISRLFLAKFMRYAGQTTKDVLFSLTDNPCLRSVLASLWIDTGSPPSRCSFMLNAAVFRGLPHEGGAYPRGGPDAMATHLVDAIEAAGGRVLVRASVEEIVVDLQRRAVTGVRVSHSGGSTLVSCGLVVSSVGFTNTYDKLLSPQVTTALSLPRELSTVPHSAGFVMCNIGLCGSAEELGLDGCNTWYHPANEQGDLFAPLDQFFADPLGSDMPMMVTFPSLKDRAPPKDPDRVTCQILVVAQHEWFAKWEKGESGKRGADYEALKQQWKDKCLSQLFRLFPQLRDRVDFADLSTPLSIEFYLREPGGGAVGLDHVPSRFTDWPIVERLQMKTEIGGLYLTGQDSLL